MADDAGRAATVRAILSSGVVIPAHPLALTAARTLDERRQRALTRYYVDAGAGGLAVGVHTTQFAIRDAAHGLYRPVLSLAQDTVRARAGGGKSAPPTTLAMVAGICGPTPQAVAEAETARTLGYDVGLLSLGALARASDHELIAHCRSVAAVIPLFGFYLQPAVGGRVLSYPFWCRVAEIENVWAVKIAPFNRYRTIDVVRAFADAGRDDVALYTGNDDAIVHDLVTPVPVCNGKPGDARSVRWFDGGLLGQWATWTRSAVDLLARVKTARDGSAVPVDLLREGAAITDANSAIFDAAHDFAGCIPGIHAILRRQGLLAGTWCLDPRETLSPGQSDEIDRVCRAYPFLTDDDFVAEHLDAWLR
ncbi:MAG TPA: dihydrodipicolinate synthase family protein [Gemmatimonadaceae bacterium]|nr:dihydrodipicolinate synthase family protein [Gemmatimonadaceae bacterium]